MLTRAVRVWHCENTVWDAFLEHTKNSVWERSCPSAPQARQREQPVRCVLWSRRCCLMSKNGVLEHVTFEGLAAHSAFSNMAVP
jgi:hypothetical protein